MIPTQGTDGEGAAKALGGPGSRVLGLLSGENPLAVM